MEVGQISEARITGITKFAAFAELGGGKTGMIHISEISYAFVNDIREHLTEGQTVSVKVTGIDENGRIALSLKKARENAKETLPQTFDDKLKQFMQSSEAKMSDLRRSERRPRGKR